MDMDSHPVPVDSQIAIYATAERNKRKAIEPPRPSSPAGPSRQPPQDSPQKKARTTYLDLPTEVIAHIADYVPPGDLVRWATVDKQTYGALTEEHAGVRYALQAADIMDLAGLQRALDAIERDITVKPSRRALPLAAFAEHLTLLPPGEQPEAFKRLFNASGAVPRVGDALQALMIAHVETLEEEQARVELFDFALAAVDTRSPGRKARQWATLAMQIPHLPETLRSERFDKLLNRIAELGPDGQADLIWALATRLEYVQQDGISGRYAQLLSRTEQLPLTLQGKPRRALNAGSRHLPDDERPGKYEHGLQASLTLPEDQRALALGGVPEGLIGLPIERHADELQRLDPIARSLPTKLTAPLAAGLMRALTSFELADQARTHALLLALTMMAGASPEDKALLLEDAIEAIDFLPAHDKVEAVNAIGRFLGSTALAADDKRDLFTYLNRRISLMQSAEMRTRATE